jgi:hypothetical protein
VIQESHDKSRAVAGKFSLCGVDRYKVLGTKDLLKSYV